MRNSRRFRLITSSKTSSLSRV